MNKKHSYKCSVIMGNMAIAETEMYKQGFTGLMQSLWCTAYTIEKVEDPSEVHNYYYEAEIDFKYGSFLKVLRFSEAVSAYARFHNHTLREHHLE